MLIGVASARKENQAVRPSACCRKDGGSQSAGATIRGFSTEKKRANLYEVEMTVNGHSKDI